MTKELRSRKNEFDYRRICLRPPEITDWVANMKCMASSKEHTLCFTLVFYFTNSYYMHV